jgi:hypothetical protein
MYIYFSWSVQPSGEVPTAQTRDQRYTAFRRLREALVEVIPETGMRPEDAQLAKAFIDQVFLRPGEVSGLECLRIPARVKSKGGES